VRARDAAALVVLVASPLVGDSTSTRSTGGPTSMIEDGGAVSLWSTGRNTSRLDRQMIGVAIGGDPHCAWWYWIDADGVQREDKLCDEGGDVQDGDVGDGDRLDRAGLNDRGRAAGSLVTPLVAFSSGVAFGALDDDDKPGDGTGALWCPSRQHGAGGSISVVRAGASVRITAAFVSFPGVVSIHAYVGDVPQRPHVTWEALDLVGTPQTRTVVVGCPARCCATVAFWQPGAARSTYLTVEVP
jgi:hypothetical protein